MTPRRIDLPVHQYYRGRVNQCDGLLEQIERRSAWLSRLRGLTFIPAAGLAVYGWVSDGPGTIWYAPSIVLLLVFLGLAAMHENVIRRSTQLKLRRRMNLVQVARLKRSWREVPEQAAVVPAEHRAESGDLDLLGSSSLFQLLSLAHTPLGRQTLRDWLLQPALPSEIAGRQEAVTALKSDCEFREDLDLRGRLIGGGESGPGAFLKWAEGRLWLAERGWLKWMTRSLSLLVAVIALAGFSGLIDPAIAWVVFLAVVLANTVVNVALLGTVYDIFNRVSSRSHDIQHYRSLFRAIENLPAGGVLFQRLQAKMGRTTHEPIHVLNKLTRIIGIANLRREALLSVPYILLQFLILTDFHLLHLLERWQQKHGPAVRGWLEAVGQLEAISSLATLAHDHPDWSLPSVCEGETVIQAVGLGHPLLPDEVCVRNDVTVGPAGTFLLVTGSNMSGKSTLLRALGVNAALAQAGGPVCAAELRMPPLRLATSMRIHDSLADGVSFFMAELQRLKEIVDVCRKLQAARPWKLLYLLDEILQGTNSAERHIAVSRVIGHLIEHGAMGVVSTHDLELASHRDLAGACQTVHFRETLLGDRAERNMTFDYKMRPGLAPTTNALKLLELVGLLQDR